MSNASLSQLLSESSGAAPSSRASERILEAALSLFVEFGLRRNTMDDVAQRAGVGRATVYRHFGDKDSLVQAVIMREIQANLEIIEKRVGEIRSAEDSLTESFVLAVSMARRNELLSRLLTSEPETILPHLTLGYGGTMALFRQYMAGRIREVQSNGQLGNIDADAVSELVLRLIQSLLLTPQGKADADDEKSLRDFADNCLRPLLHG